MESRTVELEVFGRRWRSGALAVVVGLAAGASACEEANAGSNEYFRASIDHVTYTADPNSSSTLATCQFSETSAALYAADAAGNQFTILLDNCVNGSYGIVSRADDTTTGVTECDYTPATDDGSYQLYQAQTWYPDSSCDLNIEWVDGYAMGNVYAVLIDYDVFTHAETDRVEVFGEFYLAVEEPY